MAIPLQDNWKEGVNPPRSRRCNGGAILHHVTGKLGRRNMAMIPESECLPFTSDLH